MNTVRQALTASVGLVVGVWLVCLALDYQPSWRLVAGVAGIPWLTIALLAWGRAVGNLRPPRQTVYADQVQEPVDNVRLVPVYRHQMVDGVDRRDLRHFIIDSMRTRDWTQRRWRGRKMPSGRRCDNEYHRMMVDVLRRTGVIVGGGPRRSGYLATDNISEVLERLGLDT